MGYVCNNMTRFLQDSLADFVGHSSAKKLGGTAKELNKKVSNPSHFYTLMGNFGVAIGKLGKDAKPFTNRIGELLGFPCVTGH